MICFIIIIMFLRFFRNIKHKFIRWSINFSNFQQFTFWLNRFFRCFNFTLIFNFNISSFLSCCSSSWSILGCLISYITILLWRKADSSPFTVPNWLYVLILTILHCLLTAMFDMMIRLTFSCITLYQLNISIIFYRSISQSLF